MSDVVKLSPVASPLVDYSPAPSASEHVLVETSGGMSSCVAWATAELWLCRIGAVGCEWVRVTSLVGCRWAQVLGDPLVGVYVEIGQGVDGEGYALEHTGSDHSPPAPLPAPYSDWRRATPAGTRHTIMGAVAIVRGWVTRAEVDGSLTLKENLGS